MEQSLRYISKLEIEDFRDVMETYGQDIWNYVYFLTGSADLTDDITQETFIKAFHNIGKFRGECALKTWLIKIARNLTYDYKRKSFFRRAILKAAVMIPGVSPSAEIEYFSEKTVDDIWVHVQQLPIKLREVLLLDAVHFMKVQEIAEALDIPIGTVKSRLYRARLLLARKIEKEG